jgi:hypothetical protein
MASPDWKAILKDLVAWAAEVVGFDDQHAFLSKQNGPRPVDANNHVEPYLEISFLRSREAGQASRKPPTVSSALATQEVRSNILFDIQFDFFGPGALANAQRLKDALQEIFWLDKLRLLGLVSYHARSGPQDVSFKLDTEWEERAQLDLVFGVASVRADTVGTIDAVEITGDAKDTSGGVVIQKTFTVPEE